MVAKEFYSDQEAGNEESTLLQVDPYEEEEEEALSLCDLPIYSNSISAEWGGDFSNDKDDGDDDLFEFFSEEFTTSTNANAIAENIIFCGKLIPFKDIPPLVESNVTTTTEPSNIQKGTLLPWRPINSLDKAKPTSKGSLKKGQLEAKGSKSFACDYTSIGKVKLLRSTTKSRWFLFMFGMSKLSTTGMELRDIRNRQSRRGPATMFPAPEHVKEVAIKGKRNCKGMWKMLKSISLVGCSSCKIANDVVKAAFV